MQIGKLAYEYVKLLGLITSWMGWTYTVDVATNQARGVDIMEKLDDCVV